jgi:uncharacterized protein (TIGR02757 family)
MKSPDGLKRRLERLRAGCGESMISADPVRYPRSFTRPEDCEIAGFIAAALAYGRQAHIGRSVDRVLRLLGASPASSLMEMDLDSAGARLEGFSHRFNSGGDVVLLFAILRGLLSRFGSLNRAFLAGDDPGAEDVGPGLSAFCEIALATDVGRLTHGGRIPPRSGVRFFFPSPVDGSACKRLNMFLRWMVRRDGVDPGIWKGISPSRLIIPLDTHVARVSRELGLSLRKSPDWTMAVEVTRALRRLAPEDPVRYDFALFNWGMSRAAARGSRGAA